MDIHRYWTFALPALLLLFAACTIPEDEAPTPTHQLLPGPVFGTWLPDDYIPQNPSRVLFLGDSITRGTGADTHARGYPRLLLQNDDDTWPDWVTADLESSFGPIDEIHNVSHGGDRTGSVAGTQLTQLSERIGKSVEGQSLVVITIGGNDMLLTLLGAGIHQDPDTMVASELGIMIDNLTAVITYFADPLRFPDGAYIYLTNVYDPTDAVGHAPACFNDLDLDPVLHYLDDANRAILLLAKKLNFAYVDLRGHFLGHGLNHDMSDSTWYDTTDPSQWFDPDCIHPNNRGHHEIRRLFLGAITQAPLIREY